MVCLFSPCSLLVDVWLSALCCPPGSVSDRRWSVVWYTGGVPQHSGLSGRGLQHWEKSVDRARDWVQLGTRNKEQGEGMAQEPGWKADTFQMIQIEFFPLIIDMSILRIQELAAIPFLRILCRGLHGALSSWHILDLWKTVFLHISSVSQDDISGRRLS